MAIGSGLSACLPGWRVSTLVSEGLLQCGEWWRQLPLSPSEDETGEMGEEENSWVPTEGVYKENDSWAPFLEFMGILCRSSLVQGREGPILLWLWGLDP